VHVSCETRPGLHDDLLNHTLVPVDGIEAASLGKSIIDEIHAAAPSALTARSIRNDSNTVIV